MNRYLIPFWVTVQIHISLKAAAFCSLLSMGKAKVYPICLDHAAVTCCSVNNISGGQTQFFGGNLRYVAFQETHTQLPNCKQACCVSLCCKYILVLTQCELPGWRHWQTSTQSSGLSKDPLFCHQSSMSCVALLLIPRLAQVPMPIFNSTFASCEDRFVYSLRTSLFFPCCTMEWPCWLTMHLWKKIAFISCKAVMKICKWRINVLFDNQMNCFVSWVSFRPLKSLIDCSLLF